jgi:hypothetical protein
MSEELKLSKQCRLAIYYALRAMRKQGMELGTDDGYSFYDAQEEFNKWDTIQDRKERKHE